MGLLFFAAVLSDQIQVFATTNQLDIQSCFKDYSGMSLMTFTFVVFVSPELSSERDYVITHSVCSMYVVRTNTYVVCGNLGSSFTKLITVSTYIDIFPWDLDTMILG